MAKKKTSKKTASKKAPPVEPQDNKAERQKKQREQIARKVAKITEMSTVTARQAFALVETFDEASEEAETLKTQISSQKADIAKDKKEIRDTAREFRALGDKDEQAKMGKKLAGLEQDVQRREIKLTALTEERTGKREIMKATMEELRRLIRDKAAGGLLFEKSDGSKEETSTTTRSTSTSPAGTSKPTPAADPAPPPSSKSKPELKTTTVKVGDKLSQIPIRGIERSSSVHPRAIEILAEAGITTLGGYNELAQRVKTADAKFPKGMLGSWIDALDHAVAYYSQAHATYTEPPAPAHA